MNLSCFSDADMVDVLVTSPRTLRNALKILWNWGICSRSPRRNSRCMLSTVRTNQNQNLSSLLTLTRTLR